MAVTRNPPPAHVQSKNIGVGSLSLLRWIFLTQESNRGLLPRRRILYQLSYQGSPFIFIQLIDQLVSGLSLCCCTGFSLVVMSYSGLLCSCAWASYCSGFPGCGTPVLGRTCFRSCGTWAQECGSWSLEHRLSSCGAWP